MDTDSAKSVASIWIGCVLLGFLVGLPWLTNLLDAHYYLDLVRRTLILSIAASSLNLLVGYGGMVALGHAGFMGVGAYTVAALTHAGFNSGWWLFGTATVVSAFFAAVIGAIALRTRAVHFIMLTLACGQLLYYVGVSLRIYGSDDGYNLPAPLDLGFGLTTGDNAAFYWLVLGAALAIFAAIFHLIDSRFGIALRAVKDNEVRMTALGYPVQKIRLRTFILAGALAGLSGAFLIAHNNFVTPGVMHWTQSANFIAMLVLGGLGYRWGGVVGVVVWLFLEEFLRQITTHWHWPLGLILIAIVLIAPRGLCSLIPSTLRSRNHG